jgi:hypothetical protein
MLETYQGTNLGQFQKGHATLENVSSCTVNLPAKYCQLTLLLLLLLRWLRADSHKPWLGTNKDDIWHCG